MLMILRQVRRSITARAAGNRKLSQSADMKKSVTRYDFDGYWPAVSVYGTLDGAVAALMIILPGFKT